MYDNTSRRGFTLLEVSVVLIIIGLIIGGILVGRDLIVSAKVRGTISQIEKFKSAFYTFKNKYNCIAGDCSSAVEQGLSPTNTNGNGDGFINTNSVSGPPFTVPEEQIYWTHMQNANLVAAEKTSSTFFPYNSAASKYFDGYFYVTYDQDGVGGSDNINGFAYWALVANNGIAPALSPLDAYNIDSKMDDAKPYTGQVTGGGTLSNTNGAYAPLNLSEGAAGGAFCVDNTTTPASYNRTNQTPLCVMLFKFM